MSPDEQQQFIARMKDRGADTSAFESGRGKAGRAAGRRGRSTARRPRADDRRARSRRCRSWNREAARGCSWTSELKPVNLRLGITDGTNTELLSGEMQQGEEVVTGVTGLGTTRALPGQGGSGNPLMPRTWSGGLAVRRAAAAAD